MATELFLVDIDLAGNSIMRVALEKLASAPGTTYPAHMYYDTVLDQPRIRNAANGAWINLDPSKVGATVIPLANLAVDPLARSNHTGTQAAATISNFDTQVRTTRLDQMALPTTSLDANNHTIINISDPVGNTDAANRQWVISQLQATAAGIDPKPGVRYTTTANINLTGLATQGGGDWPGALTAGDAVLVKNQTTASANGIYLASSGAWSRRVDADTGTELHSGSYVVVTEGLVNATTSWILATPNPINVGVTNQTWNQYTVATVYTGGNGIAIVGSAITAIAASGGGTSVGPGGISVDATVARTAVATTISGDDTTTTFTITHNQNKKGFPVFVSQAAAPFSQVRPGIKYPTVNTLTITFNVAPASGVSYVVDWVA